MTHRLGILSITAFAFTTFAQAQTPAPLPDTYFNAAKTMGKPGTLNADGSYRINMPRVDVVFRNSSGMVVPPDLGLATGAGDTALAVGDVAMLEGEIDHVIDNLRKGNFEVVSIHNHMTSEEPRLFYVHFQKKGAPDMVAKEFKSVTDLLGHGEKTKIAPKARKPKLDQDALAGVFGAKPQVFPSGVVRFATPRKDIKITLDDENFLPGMGLGSWAAFTACDCGLTMVMGDTACVRGDLQQVIDALRKVGIHITAIHHHVFGASIDTAFLHYEGEGDSLKLAAGIKSAWNTLGK
jgi:hypothetical protein